MHVAGTTYRFALGEFGALLGAIVADIGGVDGRNGLPTLRHIPSTEINPLSLHPNLVYTQAGAAEREWGRKDKIRCNICKHEVTVSQMQLHVDGHIIKTLELQTCNARGFCGGTSCSTSFEQV